MPKRGGNVSKLINAFNERAARASSSGSSRTLLERSTSRSTEHERECDKEELEKGLPVPLMDVPLSTATTTLDDNAKLRPAHLKTTTSDFDSSASTLVGTARDKSGMSIQEKLQTDDQEDSKPFLTSTELFSPRHVPQNAFERGADPLRLPEIDEYLDSIADASFSSIDEPGLLGDSERQSWADYLAQGAEARQSRSQGRWHAFLQCLTRKQRYTKIEDDRSDIRRDLFPPFHLIPDQVTVTDLKLNRWRPRSLTSLSAILGSAIDVVLGVEGSTIGISYTSLEGLRDLAQFLTIVEASNRSNDSPSTRMSKISAFVAFDFVSLYGHAFLIAGCLVTCAAVLCLLLARETGSFCRCRTRGQQHEWLDGEDSAQASPARRRYRKLVAFFAATLYLPLSKLAIGALVWTSDYWFVEPSQALSGTLPQDVKWCYRTSPDRTNLSWLVIMVAVCTLAFLTLWLPWRFYRFVKDEAPTVDAYTELGERRRNTNAEYERLLEDDPGPYNFLYRAYRRPWAFFKAIYMVVKLLNVLIVVVISEKNCVLRRYSAARLDIVRQVAITLFMTLFWASSVYAKAFIDPLSNNSDHVSRLSYVLIAATGLLSALKVKGYKPATTGLSTTITCITYLFNIWFTVMGWNITRRAVKRYQRRLDASIDLFSPKLDLPKHLARRIWQETLSAILLAGPEYRMRPKQSLSFAWMPPLGPYLQSFAGSQAERHVENLKILRSSGLTDHADAFLASIDEKSLDLQQQVLRNLAGPDVYWRPRAPTQQHATAAGCFGRLDVAPYPFRAVFTSDDRKASKVVFSAKEDFRHLLDINDEPDVIFAKQTRLALRAMDKQSIIAPYIEPTGSAKWATDSSPSTWIRYNIAVLTIERNCATEWRHYNYSSGFRIKLSYSDGQGSDKEGKPVSKCKTTIDGRVIGISDDYLPQEQLARIFQLNRSLLTQRVPVIEEALDSRRQFLFDEAEWKRSTLSYTFGIQVFGEAGLHPDILQEILSSTEESTVVRELPSRYRASITAGTERMQAASRSKAIAWWYIAFDDWWRRNRLELEQIRNHPEAFSPLYRSSICYRPMSREKLEAFMSSYGLRTAQDKDSFFHNGILNKLYYYLHQQSIHDASADSTGPSAWNKLLMDKLLSRLPFELQSSVTFLLDDATVQRVVAASSNDFFCLDEAGMLVQDLSSKSVWSCLPVDWQTWSNQYTDLGSRSELLKSLAMGRMPANAPTTLCDYLKSIRKLSLNRTCSFAPLLAHPPAAAEQRSQGNSNSLPYDDRRGQNPKKQHEVSRFRTLACNLLDNSGTARPTHVVDVGSGRAHLSKALACPPCNLQVLAVDFATSENMAHFRESETTTSSGSLSYRTQRLDKNSIADLLDGFPEVRATTCTMLVALHACGNLTADALEAFTASDQADRRRSLIAVGCCYHLLDQHRFPMSEAVRQMTEGRHLSVNHRMIAQQAPATWYLSDSHTSDTNAALARLFNRARLEPELKKIKSRLGTDVRVGRVREARSFEAFRMKALSKLGESTTSGQPPCASTLDLDTAEFRFRLFWTLRCLLGPPLESLLVLDRYMYLVEKLGDVGTSDRSIELVNLFDQATGSLRNMALVVRQTADCIA